MLLCLFLGFLLATGLDGGVLWLAFRRVSRHLQGNPEAVKAVADHVLIPLLGRKPESDSKQSPDGKPAPASAAGGNAQDTNNAHPEPPRAAPEPRGRGRYLA
jgi:hypothetical protein